MHFELIRERAEIIYELIEEKIDRGLEMESGDYLDAFKATFALKSKSIRNFKRAFEGGDLNFCIMSVEAVYENFSMEIPGPGDLTWDEKEILRQLQNSINEGSERALFY
jgi:hypothetical protein